MDDCLRLLYGERQEKIHDTKKDAVNVYKICYKASKLLGYSSYKEYLGHNFSDIFTLDSILENAVGKDRARQIRISNSNITNDHQNDKNYNELLTFAGTVILAILYAMAKVLELSYFLVNLAISHFEKNVEKQIKSQNRTEKTDVRQNKK